MYEHKEMLESNPPTPNDQKVPRHEGPHQLHLQAASASTASTFSCARSCNMFPNSSRPAKCSTTLQLHKQCLSKVTAPAAANTWCIQPSITHTHFLMWANTHHTGNTTHKI